MIGHTQSQHQTHTVHRTGLQYTSAQHTSLPPHPLSLYDRPPLVHASSDMHTPLAMPSARAEHALDCVHVSVPHGHTHRRKHARPAAPLHIP
jgi:hypothetical protein